MASNLSCIGLPIESEEEFESLAEAVFPSAETISVKGGAYLRATDESGAELWLQLNSRDEIIGMNPHFTGVARFTAGITASVDRSESSPLDGAYHAWANPTDDDSSTGEYPFVFDMPDFLVANHLRLPYRADLQIAAFGQQVDCYDSPEAHGEAQDGETKFASESFIPAGLFSPDGESTTPPTAHAIMAGTVLAAEERVNSWTGTRFYYCQLRSLGGEYDVVLDPSEAGRLPLIGGVVAGTFWLSGRVLNPPRRKKGRLEKILRR